MKIIVLFIILGACAFAALLVVVALYRHKNSASGPVKLIGELGRVTSSLTPEGAVMVHEELWPARSEDETHIVLGTEVRIVRFRDHLLIVTPNVDHA